MNRLHQRSMRPSCIDRYVTRQIQLESSYDFLRMRGSCRGLGATYVKFAAWVKQILTLIGFYPRFTSSDEQLEHHDEFSKVVEPTQADGLPIEIALMRARAKIIVEKQLNQWTAWFAEVPQNSICGEFPRDAVWRLLRQFEAELQCDVQEIATIDSATTKDHLEFSVPYWRLKRSPKPSLN